MLGQNINGVLFLQKGLWSLIRLTISFPNTCFQLPHDVISSAARFGLRVHTLHFETATWNRNYSLICDLCDTDDVQDEQHVLFHCANPHVISLRR
jgi:hypothetical protein